MIKYFSNIPTLQINKGLNTNKNFFSLEQGQSPACIDVEFNQDNSFGKRYGTTTLNSIALETTSGYGMYDCGINTAGIDTATKLLLHCDGQQNSPTVNDEIGKTMVHSNIYTKFLCHFDGAQGATSYTSDVGNLIATFGSGAVLDRGSPKFGTACLGLSSANQSFVTFPDNDLFHLGTKNFVIECYLYFISTAGSQTFFTINNSDADYCYLHWNGSQWSFSDIATGANVTVTDAKLPTKTWVHFALVRNGSNFTIYRDGSSMSTTGHNVDIKNYTNPVCIGDLRITDISYNQFFNGNIDDFHILVSTSNGPVKYYEAFTPVARAIEIHDISNYKFGAAALDFQKSFVKTTTSNDFDFASNNFTIDYWTKLLQLGTGEFQAFVSTMANSSNYWYMAYSNNGVKFTWVDTGVVKVMIACSALLWNTSDFVHLELVRNGTNWSLYKDGSMAVTTNTDTTLAFHNTTTYIGAYSQGTSGYLNGLIDEFRISNGIARHTANFTPPIEAYGSTTEQLRRLICAAGTGIYYSTDVGKTWAVCASGRYAITNYFSFAKNYVIDTNDMYEKPLYWTGTAGVHFAQISTAAPLCKYALTHQGYFIMLNEKDNKRSMYYVDEASMLTAAFSNFAFPTDKNDELTGGFVLNNILYVSTKYKLFRCLYIGGNPDWSYYEVKNFGFVPKTMKKIQIPKVGQVVIGLDYNKNIRIFDGTDDEIISVNIKEDNGLTPFYMDKLNGSLLDKAWSENDTTRNIYKLFIAYDSANKISHSIEYNYQAGSFAPHANRSLQSGVLVGDTANGLYMVGCDYTGYIHKMDSGNTDNGIAINERYESALLYKQNPTTVIKAQQIDAFFSVTSSGTLYWEDRTDFSSVYKLNRSFTLGSAISSIQIRETIDIPETMNVYQYKLSSSANTAEPWRCTYINFIESEVGVGVD